MWRYFIKADLGMPKDRDISGVRALYRIDRTNPIERYVGQGAWEADPDSGKIASNIAGFGGNWYDYDQITLEELEKVMRMLDERLAM
jgi:hypothetical protein